MQARHFARWYTSMGEFTADIRDDILPNTANNFISLTNSGFYDGLLFYGIQAGYVIRDGDPLGNGTGGPGYNIPFEYSSLLHHDSPGVFGMQHISTPSSSGSRYYFTLAATPQLDGLCANFGKVFDGLDVVLAIGQVPVDANYQPLTNVYIDSLRILDLVINNAYPSPDNLVIVNSGNPLPVFSVEAYNSDFSVQYGWYIDEVLLPDSTGITFTPHFSVLGNHTVKCKAYDDQMSWTTLWNVLVIYIANEDATSSPAGFSVHSVSPNPFSSQTKLSYSLECPAPVSFSVFDAKGKLLHSEILTGDKGTQTTLWQAQANGKPLPSGIYLLRLSDGKQTQTRKAVLIR